jgi:hypothetical protein
VALVQDGRRRLDQRAFDQLDGPLHVADPARRVGGFHQDVGRVQAAVRDRRQQPQRPVVLALGFGIPEHGRSGRPGCGRHGQRRSEVAAEVPVVCQLRGRGGGLGQSQRGLRGECLRQRSVMRGALAGQQIAVHGLQGESMPERIAVVGVDRQQMRVHALPEDGQQLHA